MGMVALLVGLTAMKSLNNLHIQKKNGGQRVEPLIISIGVYNIEETQPVRPHFVKI